MIQPRSENIVFLVIALFLIIPFSLPAQSFEQMELLYTQKKYNELRKLVEGNNSDDPALVFFKTVFNENGDESIGVYESLFKRTQDRLKELIAGKISQYYYAKGFYIKAQEYSQFAAMDEPVQTETSEVKKIYQIQVGAFGYQENAQRMQELLNVRDIHSSIESRVINGKMLYCVWIPGAETYRNTVEMADDLKQKYKLNYQIINP